MRIFILVIFLSTQVCAQTVKRQTFASQGISKTLNSGVFVSQSVGQSSIIGLMLKPNITVQQGYQQSRFSIPTNVITYHAVQVTTFPNPFINVINLKFSKAVTESVTIMVADLYGKLLFQKTFLNPELGLNFQLDNLAPQSYILSLNGATFNYSTKIVKAY
ncbi:T9SS type A sorting domain-containing protein [Pedobacter psychrophilus]|nr:T9SS type A sorting domain-containing protein [Pedobacter psychrophilus]